MSKRTEVLRIPLDFTTSNEFTRLRILTKEDTPIVLGRVIALALAVFELRRVKMHIAEVDAITAWRVRDQYFAEHLVRIGWAKIVGSVAELRLPSALQPFSRFSLNAKAWASVAKRDDKGRYLRKPGATPRKPPRPVVAINADGDAVGEASS